MTHATKCATLEGNQGCNEWMTVIKMQEYMGASRSKAYDLIWSREIDSYRLSRKLLLSRGSVDGLHRIEERQEMMATTAREPLVAGHTRAPRDERSLRRIVTENTSSSQVRLIASTSAIIGDEACATLRISHDTMYQLTKDPDGPFPIQFLHVHYLKPLSSFDARKILGSKLRPFAMIQVRSHR